MKAKNSPKYIPGVNIQWPWSRLLLSGEKTIETRGYPIPAKLIGNELAIIETPGPRGRGAGIRVARIVGTIIFSEHFQYTSRKDWIADQKRHRVEADDPLYSFRAGTQKWGWVVGSVRVFDKPISAPSSKGIRFTKKCRIPAS